MAFLVFFHCFPILPLSHHDLPMVSSVALASRMALHASISCRKLRGKPWEKPGKIIKFMGKQWDFYHEFLTIDRFPIHNEWIAIMNYGIMMGKPLELS